MIDRGADEKIARKASLTATANESGFAVLFTLAPFVRLLLLPSWSQPKQLMYAVGRQQASHHLRLSISKPKQLVMDGNEINRRGCFLIGRTGPTDGTFSFSSYSLEIGFIVVAIMSFGSVFECMVSKVKL